MIHGDVCVRSVSQSWVGESADGGRTTHVSESAIGPDNNRQQQQQQKHMGGEKGRRRHILLLMVCLISHRFCLCRPFGVSVLGRCTDLNRSTRLGALFDLRRPSGGDTRHAQGNAHE